jgi:selenoprotein W-related protein
MEKARIDIEYCPRCGWMLRAAWLAQELLTTFSEDVAAVALVPSTTNGTFRISVDDVLVWCRKADAGFPQAAELKQRIRDRIAPGRALGHADKADKKDT